MMFGTRPHGHRPPLMFLHDIHSKLIDQYDCKEVCVPSPSQFNTGPCSRLNSQDVVSQQQETASLSLPQINHLFDTDVMLTLL
jgi:hypothetical protein